jgi:predicted alpha/beta superfamily hydrolase
MKQIITSIFLLITFFNWCQVTLRVTNIPSNTPNNATLYAVGSFNNWNPMDSNYILQPNGQGAYLVTIPAGTGTVEYKFTRGSWATVEGNANGGFLHNRTFTHSNAAQTINHSILSWEDLGGSNPSTAASNVQVLNTAFVMPQLNRTRKIWLYLPPDYFTTTKNYPVIYMNDGQNLFDQVTSFSGEWQVDETLNSLHAAGDYGAIVVGIDNGSAERLNEYSPWVNSQYGGGQGHLYMQFVANTLKPYIDANFRTLPQPSMNVLFGSSMGALIATYGSLEHNAFQKVGVFSPAYWFAWTNFTQYINSSTQNLNNHRMYFLSGANESATMVPYMTQTRNNLQSKGMSSSNTFTKIDANGTHSESYWRNEFGAAYQWLFANANLNKVSVEKSYQNISTTYDNQIYVTGFTKPFQIEIYNILGKKIIENNVQNGVNSLSISLDAGLYFVKTEENKVYKLLFR